MTRFLVGDKPTADAFPENQEPLGAASFAGCHAPAQQACPERSFWSAEAQLLRLIGPGKSSAFALHSKKPLAPVEQQSSV